MLFDDKEFIAKKIKIFRKKSGLTQAQIAEKIGISSKQFSRIESATHTPSLPTFLKILYLLKINPSEFGIDNVHVIANEKRDEFIKFIYSMDEIELDFAFKTLKDIFGNLELLKS